MAEDFVKNISEMGRSLAIDKKLQDNLGLNDGRISYKYINNRVNNIYEITYKNSNLYFIDTDNYIIIFDTLDNISSKKIDVGDGQFILPSILSGILFPGCISLIYDKKHNILHIDFIKILPTCKFGDLNDLQKGTEKIFSKIFGILKKLKFNGKILLDDMAHPPDDNEIYLADLRITYKDLPEISIYQGYGFKINPKNYDAVKEINTNIKKLIAEKYPDKKVNYPVSTDKGEINAKDVYNALQKDIKNYKLYQSLEDMVLNFPDDIINNKLYQSAGKKNKYRKTRKTRKTRKNKKSKKSKKIKTKKR